MASTFVSIVEWAYANNVEALAAIIDDAKACNNKLLEEAAIDVLEQVYVEYVERNMGIWKELKDWGEETGTFVLEFRANMSDVTSNIIFNKVMDKVAGGIMTYVSIGATAVDLATNHSEVYESAEKLMALGTMASSMDLSTVTKNANGAGYTYKLWAELQAAGCDQAKDFLEQHADSPDAWDIALWGASAYIRTVTIDELGIPDEDRDVVYKMLDADKQRYLEFGENSIGK